MAYACKCDRCGKMFEPYLKNSMYNMVSVNVRDLSFGTTSSRRKYDLCKDCSEEVQACLDRNRKEEIND